MNMLFRQAALTKVTDPDELDRSLEIVRPMHILGLSLVAAVTLAGVLWSILATAPERVGGEGVLLSTAGVGVVTSPDTGWIERLLVRPGDVVEKDAPVAEIRRPDLLDQWQSAVTEAEQSRHYQDALQRSNEAQWRLADEQEARLLRAYREHLASLDAQHQILLKLNEGMSKLREKGAISTESLIESQARLGDLEDNMHTIRNQMTELEVEHETTRNQQRRELDQARMQADLLHDQAENLRREYERDRLARAPAAGLVVEVSVSEGDPLTPGQAIARLLSSVEGDPRGVKAMAFVPAADGKRIQTGMEARVALSTVKRELDGYLLGTVIRVAELPSNRASLMNLLRNDVLVDKILAAGPPLEIEVELRPSPVNPSGYVWSSGKGPAVSIQPGILTQTEVVVGRTHLISLLFPVFDHVFGWYRAATR
ncbi:NHLP bacteriocin system secretion protein [Thiocystis violacea]|uniref:NHLP bacteriocin system secretion protein n=1 Tax=Thiocystis violacea TaxID=13725 RepID=UPI0019040D72|nr:NHLP bacteriocin system secretion protein [Thiocystis violacea]MBK1719864.1 NHLP bacteriocin system secretion protein [Thiocystis violacea]